MSARASIDRKGDVEMNYNFTEEMPEEPKGVGSVIRVLFKGEDEYTYYVGVHDIGSRLWFEYNTVNSEFTWSDFMDAIPLGEFYGFHGEIVEFSVVYEGYSDEGNV